MCHCISGEPEAIRTILHRCPYQNRLKSAWDGVKRRRHRGLSKSHRSRPQGNPAVLSDLDINHDNQEKQDFFCIIVNIRYNEHWQQGFLEAFCDGTHSAASAVWRLTLSHGDAACNRHYCAAQSFPLVYKN